jgi:DNA-binding SARP family transcriptional activator
MEFRLLGPLEVLDSGLKLELGGVKQRSLLAVLLLHFNEVVSVDRLTDELWGSSPPRTAGKSIQVYVSRLRKQLGDDRILTQPPGYLLRAAPSELDVARAEQLIASAQQADPPTASQRLREALDLWRGSPLDDLAFEPFAYTEVARLDELQWVALESRIDADLAAARHASLLPELQSLIRRHPLRERLHRQLMLALYRSGRQAEALDAYRRARDTLMEELGLEPGDELKRLERSILQQDPVLDLPIAPVQSTSAPAPERSLIVVPNDLAALDALLTVATPLAADREVIVAAVVPASELAEATAALGARRDALMAKAVAVRTAAFTSPSPARDLARIAAKESTDLLLTDLAGETLDDELLDHAPCDVAMLVRCAQERTAGAIVVPFGAGWHDWAALDLGAQIAKATNSPLQLLGAAADHGRDASRLLADASLILQRTAGIAAEPRLAAPGGDGVFEYADEARLLVMGLSDRYKDEGLGRLRCRIAADPPAPTLFVRRGPRRGALAPSQTATRFGWSLTASPA